MNLTKKEIEEIKNAAVRVWNYVSSDAGECSVDEAIELALDAGRPVTIGGLSQELYEKMCKEDWEEIEKLMRSVFRGRV